MDNLRRLTALLFAFLLVAGCKESQSENPPAGDAGPQGLSSLIRTEEEPPGENCESGGTRVSAGIDENANSVLDDHEVTSVVYICHGDTGATGVPGADGCDSLIVIEDEPPGQNCPAGGKKITVGTDDGVSSSGESSGSACDGILDLGEVDQVEYLCFPEDDSGLATVLLTVTTGMHENAGVADAAAPSFCLRNDMCFGPLNHAGPDDYARGLTDTYRIENVELSLSEIEEITFKANGSDGWQPTCIEVQWNGNPLYCNDSLDSVWVQTDGDVAWTAQDSIGDNLVHFDGCVRGTCYPSEVAAGPIVGAVTSHSANVWVRAAVQHLVEIRVSENLADLEFSEPVVSASPRHQDDYALTLRVNDLSPSTLYYYNVRIGATTTVPRAFSTAPPVGSQEPFTFVTGSCTRLARDDEQIVFSAMQSMNPEFFLFLGDSHYANSGSLERLRAFQRRIRTVPARAEFLASVPVYATWDDHDFIQNNSGGVGHCDIEGTVLNGDEEAFCGETRPPANPSFNEDASNFLSKRDNALKAFKENWPNPAFGTAGTAGVFFSFTFGDVEFFVLDSRYHRTQEFVPGTHSAFEAGTRLAQSERKMFGDEQLDWLKQALRASTATFKFLASGSTWSDQGSNDSFAYFDVEREALFDFIAAENISGVILLSGDIHRSGFVPVAPANKAFTGGYDFPELISSPLANSNGGNCSLDGSQDYATTLATQCFNAGHYFMTIEVDSSLIDPKVVARVYSSGGSLQGTPLEIRLSELQVAQ